MKSEIVEALTFSHEFCLSALHLQEEARLYFNICWKSSLFTPLQTPLLLLVKTQRSESGTSFERRVDSFWRLDPAV